METSVLDRINQLVAQLGRSKRDLASDMFLDETKFNKALKGKRQFSALELASLAQIGGTTVDWLVTGVEPRTIEFAFRADQLENLESVSESLAEDVELLVERRISFAALGELEPIRELYPPESGWSYTAWGRSAGEWALDLLQDPVWSLSNASLIDEIERAFDIDVVVGDLPDSCDGASYSDAAARVIVLQRTSNAARQRFTLGHELGHLLHGDTDGALRGERLQFSKANNNDEARANSFASNFLMPEAEVREIIGSRQVTDVFDELVFKFRVSPASLAWRLLNLKLISEIDAHRFRAQSVTNCMEALGWEAVTQAESADTESARTRRPKQLVAAAMRAFRSHKATIRPLAQVLGVSDDNARRVMWSDNEEGSRL